MTKIAETYISLDVEPKDNIIKEITYFLEDKANPIIKELFGEASTFTITMHKGSLVILVTVFGSIYAALAAYGSFRSGIDYIVADARKFSDILCNYFFNKFNFLKAHARRIERRVGIPGSIQRLYRRIDRLPQVVFTDLPDGRPCFDEKDSILEEIKKILNNLGTEKEKQIFIASLPAEFLMELKIGNIDHEWQREQTAAGLMTILKRAEHLDSEQKEFDGSINYTEPQE